MISTLAVLGWSLLTVLTADQTKDENHPSPARPQIQFDCRVILLKEGREEQLMIEPNLVTLEGTSACCVTGGEYSQMRLDFLKVRKVQGRISFDFVLELAALGDDGQVVVSRSKRRKRVASGAKFRCTAVCPDNPNQRVQATIRVTEVLP